MKITKTERYIHLSQCGDDFNDAFRVFSALKSNVEQGVLIGAAFRYGLIAYARPYLQSKITTNSDLKLKKTHIPNKHRDLHREILSLRNKVHAHSDMSIREAKLFVSESRGKRNVGQIMNGQDKFYLYDRLDDLIELTQMTIESLRKEVVDMESSLPLTK